MHGRRRTARRACTAAAVGLVALAALAGGAGTGKAGATLLTVSLDDIGPIGKVTAGGKVAYAASVLNSGPSTVSHVSLVVDTPLANAKDVENVEEAGTFVMNGEPTGAGSPSCAEDPDDASRMICTARQLAPFEEFSVNVVFSTPAAFEAIEEGPVLLAATAMATVSAQTNGNPDNQGTSFWKDETPPVVELTEDSDDSFRSFSLPDENVEFLGVELETKIGLPAAFVVPSDHFGLVTETGKKFGTALCDKCPTVFSTISIPASLDEHKALNRETNPFALFDDDVLVSTSPYTFELTLNPAGQPRGYKVSGIRHQGDEDGAPFVPVKLCSDVTLGSDNPVCLDALPSKNKKTGVITATGRGIENGNWGWD